MHEKGMLSREKDGKTHIYSAKMDEVKTQENLVSRMINKVFDGSSKQLVIQALGSQQPSKEELDEIRKYLDELNNDGL